MERSRKKELFNLCDPYKSFDVDNKINIQIDEFYNDPSLLRGCNWAEELFDTIDYGEGDTFQLFTGYSGSGKTTELKKVTQMAKDDYLVVFIDAEEYIDINIPMDIADLYTTIVYNTVKEVNKLFGKKNNFNDEGYFYRLNNWLQSEVTLKQIKSKNFVFEMKDTSTFRQQVRTHINDNFSKFKLDTKKELHDLNEKVKKKKEKGILIILDSLEKNRGISLNYEEVIASSETIFSNRDHLSLPVNIIYTVPIYLSERIRSNRINFLPAIKVKTKEDMYFKEGIDLLKELIYHRVEKADLKEILGDDYENKLEKIIKFSGGYPRDLLIILGDIIKQKIYPVENNIIDKILANEQNSFQELLNTEIQEALKIVKKSKSIKDITIKDKLLTNHLILRYRNDVLWFDIHPAIEELLK